AFVLMSVFLDNLHFINHLRHSCPFLCKIQAKAVGQNLAYRFAVSKST
ncbi:hypothetical protein RCH09_003561, partial [Actimicrobium sp. GrIS 1.19]|nr:hypothetical protein [Actimicrobium sp. GrIS 1.19]